MNSITIPNYRKQFLKQLKDRMAKVNPQWEYSIYEVTGGYEIKISWED